jgi:hypothetical protein
MTKAPQLDHRVASAEEMKRLFADDSDLQKRIGECRIQVIQVRENIAPGIAKQTINRFLDPESPDNDEIAIITDYEKLDGDKYTVVSKLLIGNLVYQHQIPD